MFKQNGYRSAHSGTYWSAFRAVADEFNIGYQETTSLDKAVELLRNNNYVIASCGNGLFTTGGHFIVLIGVEGDTIKIYDPYLYNGKFQTASRRKANVKVQGNTVYVSIESFRKYANYRGFFAYEYKPGEIVKENTTDNKVVTQTNIKNTVGQTYRLARKTKLYTSSSMDNGYNYLKGTKVTVLENITSKIDKVRINATGLVRYVYNADYTATTQSATVATSSSKTYRTTCKTKMYTSSSMKKGYNYLSGTKVTVLSKSGNIAKVKVKATGIVRYINVKYLK